MATLFTRIIQGEIKCYKILEDERYFAFLDHRPINPGHTLVVPKEEIDSIFDLDEQLVGGLMRFAGKIAAALRKTFPYKRVGIMVAGMEVPHAHIHLIPINTVFDLSFAKTKPAGRDELAANAGKIRANL